eukprot:188528-Pelagomonas_calceolata.AAC.3
MTNGRHAVSEEVWRVACFSGCVQLEEEGQGACNKVGWTFTIQVIYLTGAGVKLQKLRLQYHAAARTQRVTHGLYLKIVEESRGLFMLAAAQVAWLAFVLE